jgi:hypothetical protein
VPIASTGREAVESAAAKPGLPLKKGRAGTMRYDYKRHGTTALFAALNVASGEIVAEARPLSDTRSSSASLASWCGRSSRSWKSI